MPTEKRKFGDVGEKIACYFLKNKGYLILEINYQKRIGEIDIVARLNDTLHFMEVKARTNFSNDKFGAPQESVNYHKQKRLIKTALFYLLEKKYPDSADWQIDVIAITIDKDRNTAKINHIKNAVDYSTL